MTDDTKHRQNDASEPQREDAETLARERDEYLQGWKRAKADYENLARETEKRKTEYADWAVERAVSVILPALDQFDVAMDFAPELDGLPEEKEKAFRNWLVGLEAVRSLWKEAASNLGLERISSDGAFDPDVHEAVGEEKSGEIPEGRIVRTTVPGYRLNGRTIRPARVIVSGGAP